MKKSLFIFLLMWCMAQARASMVLFPSVTNYEITAKIEIENGAFALLFGAQNANSYLMWSFEASDGALKLVPRKYVNRTSQKLAEADLTSYVEKAGPGIEYNVRITVTDGLIIETYLNEQLVATHRNMVPLRTVGFKTMNGESGYVDDLKVTTSDGKILFQQDFNGLTSGFSDGELKVGGSSTSQRLYLSATTAGHTSFINQARRVYTLHANETATVQAEDYDLGGLGSAYMDRQGFYKNPTGEEFPIMAWYSIHPDTAITRERYLEMAEAGFNISFSHFSSADQVAKALEASKGTGVKQMITCNELSNSATTTATVNRFKDHEMVAGWFLRDEPTCPEFASLASFRNLILAGDRNHVLYLNLLPAYVDPSALGSTSYEDYVERFVNEVDLGLISYDNYPIVTNGKTVYVQDKFYKNLHDVYTVSKRHNQPFWAFALTTAHGAYPVPTRKHLRYQIFSDLAYGAQGIQYFTYWTPLGTIWDFHNAPIDENGKRTDVWYLVKELNQEVQALSWVFLGAKVLDVGHTGASVPTGTKRFTTYPIKFRSVSSANLLVSHFVNGQNHFLMLFNRDFNSTQRITINKADDVKRVLPTGEAVDDTANNRKGVNVSPGDYLLYTWTE